VPLGIEREVTISKVADPDPATYVGEKVAVAPAGRPVRLRLTVSLNPPMPVMVTLYEVLFPALTLFEPGETPIEKSALAGACTFKLMVAVWIREPLCPVIVTV
jgi:hypothetical protein